MSKSEPLLVKNDNKIDPIFLRNKHKIKLQLSENTDKILRDQIGLKQLTKYKYKISPYSE